MAEESVAVWIQEATLLADLFTQLTSKTLSQRLLKEVPEAKALELTLPQLHVLRYLWLHEHVLVGELAEGLSISYPSATNMIKRLAEKHLTASSVNPQDRREVEILLTEKGRSLISLLEQERADRFCRILERMGDRQRDALMQGLRQFIALAVGNGSEDLVTANEICLRCGRRASETCPIAQIIPLFPCK